MTRLRLTLHDPAVADLKTLKSIPGVLGAVVDENEYQVVLGPGRVVAVAAAVNLLLARADSPETMKEAVSMQPVKNSHSLIKPFLKRLSAIFVPLIPITVASGMIAGITNIAVKLGADPQSVVIQILAALGWGVFGYLTIFVGFQTAREFGGTPAMGGLAGVILINPAIAGIQIDGMAMLPGRGGVVGVLLVAGFMVWLEKKIRPRVPAALDILITPTLTVLIGGLTAYLVLQPIGGLLSDGVIGFLRMLLDVGGVVAGGILAGFFLPLVMTGLHQGLTPIHMELLQTLKANPLLPVLAMAGAGQVGASLAILIKTRNTRLKQIIKGALPVGFMGIGEPLIFGVTLPLGRPFFTACAGAAVGGAWQAVMQVESVAMGVSGLPLAFLIRGDQVLTYLTGLLLAYAGGFIITLVCGFADPVEDTEELQDTRSKE